MAFSLFKKKKEETTSPDTLKINIPGMEYVAPPPPPAAPAPAASAPAPASPAGARPVKQLPCDSIYAFKRNMLICPYCETIITDRKRHCPACGLYF